MIQVKVYGNLSIITKGHELSAHARSVRQLYEVLSERFGDEFSRAVKASKVFHNGKNIAFNQGKRTKLHDGDEVVFLSPVAGG